MAVSKHLYLYLTWADPNTGVFNTFRHPLDGEVGVSVSFGRRGDNTIVLPDNTVSLEHAHLTYENGLLTLKDLDSLNGIWVEGQRRDQVLLEPPGNFQIGPFIFECSIELEPGHQREHQTVGEKDEAVSSEHDTSETILFAQSNLSWLIAETQDKAKKSQPSESELPPPPAAVLLPPVFSSPQIDLAQLEEEFAETRYLTVGGGLASFAWVDRLLIAGAKNEDITIIGTAFDPVKHFQRLCKASQISPEDRLRCDTRQTLDNIWGWPGYALRESWQHLTHGNLKQAARINWQLVGAPFMADHYHPRLKDFIEGMRREVERINWEAIWQFGYVLRIRQTTDGRYLVIYSPTGQVARTQYKLIVTTHLHIAFGSPGIRFAPDLQAYRVHTGDFRKVVNAYEVHEHLYQDLRENGGDVLLRGQGMAAARIFHRLALEQRRNPNINIIHLQDAPRVNGNRYGFNRRRVENYWELQELGWPKAVYRGDLHDRYTHADQFERDQLLVDWGGITVIPEREWLNLIKEGLTEGWYQPRFGSIEQVRPTEEGSVVTIIHSTSTINEETRITTDFIIDATDLKVAIENHPVIQDLISTYDLPRTSLNTIHVSEEFEVAGLRNESGRVYLSGAMAAGGPYAPAGTFAGHQFAAGQSVNALRKLKAPGIRRLVGWTSLTQWLRWMIGASPA